MVVVWFAVTQLLSEKLLWISGKLLANFHVVRLGTLTEDAETLGCTVATRPPMVVTSEPAAVLRETRRPFQVTDLT